MNLAIKYIIFAIIATAGNLLSQRLVFQLLNHRYELYIGILIGTLVGLVIKYVLDKKYIFAFVTADLKDDLHKFTLYSIMGVITTLIFWGAEVSFDWIFKTESARYVGAIIGLSIGYYTKYRLDKRFVFNRSDQSVLPEI